MAEVRHGNTSGNQLNTTKDKSQLYGLAGDDTLVSDGKSGVLMVGGSGDDRLIIKGGNGTLNGGAGNDTFELNYSASQTLSAVIEDLDPSSDKIVVNFDGNTTPQLTREVRGNDVVLRDGDERLNITLKGVRENDYFDGEATEESWDVLKLTNEYRESQGKSPLTLSEGLMAGASIRAQEITALGEGGVLTNHTRPNGEPYYTVSIDGQSSLREKYSSDGENLAAGANSPAEVMDDWIGSASHQRNILDEDFLKIGIGYNYYDEDPSDNVHYWTQIFADSLKSPETVGTADLLTANLQVNALSSFIVDNDNSNVINNTVYGATIQALGGNDSITNSIANVSISGGAGNDSINNSGVNSTINGGKGNDSIILTGDAQHNLIEYIAGDGSDTIGGFNVTSTLSIAGDEYTPATVGNDVVVAVGNDSITLKDAASLSSVNIDGTRSKLFIGTEDAETFNNTLEGAIIQALGGNDSITNSGNNSTVDGGAGDDSITNSGNNSTVDGGAGDDSITNSGDNSTVDGGAGDDSITNSGNNSTVDGGAGNDSITNSGDNSTVNGSAGNDSITNSGNNSTVNGGRGDDRITITEDNQHANNILLIYNEGDGNDSIIGFNGNDTLRIGDGTGTYSTQRHGDNLVLTVGKGKITLTNAATLSTVNISGIESTSGGASSSTPTNLKFIMLTDGNDTYNVTVEGATVAALGGNDSVYNRASNVLINGGDDNDTINNYGGTNVSISGGNGNDYISNSLNEIYHEETRTWETISSPDNAIIDGSAGNDYIDNYGFNTTIIGGAGDDTVYNHEAGMVYVYRAGDGNDLIYNFGVLETLIVDGAEFTTVKENDYSWGDWLVKVGNNTITLSGAAGLAKPNIVSSTEIDSVNIVTNERSNTTINGKDSSNWIRNYADNVTINGGKSPDDIYNAGANAAINGNDGNDRLSNYNSNATINGGDGDDSISNWWRDEWNEETQRREFVSRGDNSTINAGNGNDSIENESENVSISGGEGNDTIYNYGSGTTILGGDGNDSITNGSWNVTINAGTGNDYINNWQGNVSISGGDGDDSIFSENINATIDGGAGNDNISLDAYYGARNLITYTEGDGNDTIYGYDPSDTLTLMDTSITSSVISGNDLILYVGEEGSITFVDTRSVNVDGTIINPTSLATSGNDFITNFDSYVSLGGAGNDTILNGGNNVAIDIGNDYKVVKNYGYWATINGSAGNDTISNGGEYTSILGGEGNDSITNGRWDVTIDAGTGDDTVSNRYERNLIIAGDGDDDIYNKGNDATIDAGTGNDTVYNDGGGDYSYIELGEGNDSIYSADEDYSTINGGDGNDSISGSYWYSSINGGTDNDAISLNYAYYTTVDGGDGDDTIIAEQTNYNSINGGDGNDSISGSYWYSSINGGTDNDTISLNYAYYTTVDGGDGDDTIIAEQTNYNSINGGDGDDLISLSGSYDWYVVREVTTIRGGTGNDTIYGISSSNNLYGDMYEYVTGDGNDTIYNFSENSTLSIAGGAYTRSTVGNDVIIGVDDGSIVLSDAARLDTINIIGTLSNSKFITLTENDDAYTNLIEGATIAALGGNDRITNNSQSNVSINGGSGSDTINNSGANVTITGGNDNDRISLSGGATDNLIRYFDGDGNDTVWGFSANTTLNFLGGDYSSLSTLRSGNDLIVRFGEGSIRLVDARNKPIHIILGESGSSGGIGGNGGNSSGGNSSGGNDGGNSSGGNSEGGTSASEGRGSDASGGRSASGSSGTSSGIGNGSGGNGLRRKLWENDLEATQAISPNSNLITSQHSSSIADFLSSTKQTQPVEVVNQTQHIYTGGNQVIANYTSGKKIIFGETYTGSFYDSAGNFLAGSSTGALVVQNAVDKVIDLSDAAGNSVIKAYAASSAGVIDGRGLSGFEVINGSAGGDVIYAGDGGSQLWGGNGIDADVLVGGNGSDIFIGGRTQGNDFFLNTSAADMIHLNDAALSDIIATEEENGTIAVAFNTGNAIAVQSSEPLSAAFLLADGSAYRYNHVNKSWQSA